MDFFPTRDYHPATVERKSGPTKRRKSAIPQVKLPKDKNNLDVAIGERLVKLTNLNKLFWPKLGVTKRDLIQYYLDMAPVLLPHVIDRAMVMKRYPHGAAGEFFFMKRAPSPRPDWIEICNIEHESGNIINFPMIQDVAALMWVINLGCIDLNQWYARCDDVDRPDYIHFDLDPVPNASFEKVREAALFLKLGLDSLKIPSFAKTTGSKGIHIYIPIKRGPTQKQVWTFAKQFAWAVASQAPKLLTAVYQVSKRPKGRVLVDYNQNAWGRTLA
jgi:bifunctional non-homologous end joining protein LigD